MSGQTNPAVVESSANTADTSNSWKMLSDIVDDCIGVKGRPHRLIIYANGFLSAVFGCVILLWSLVPEPIADIDKVPLSAFTFRRGEAALRSNAHVLASNIWIIRYGLIAFAICIVILAVLVTIIGRVIIQDEASRQKKM